MTPADIRADVYSMGCTLYELLAGRAPFARPEWPTREAKMRAHTLVPPPPIRELRSEVTAALAGVLDRLLAKCPADRYGTLAEVVRALDPFTTGHDLRALLPPNPSLPTTADIAGPSVTDLAGSRGTRPEPGWWLPQWDWSNRPKSSRPIAVPAILTCVTILLLTVTIWNRWQRLDPAAKPVQGDFQVPPTPAPSPRFPPATRSARLWLSRFIALGQAPMNRRI